MKKTERWKSMRVQKKREKQRIRKQTKPEHEGTSGRQMVTDKHGFNIFALLSRPVPKAKKRDRRERDHSKSGDR